MKCLCNSYVNIIRAYLISGTGWNDSAKYHTRAIPVIELNSWPDSTLYIVLAQYTYRSELSLNYVVMRLLKIKEAPSLLIILGGAKGSARLTVGLLYLWPDQHYSTNLTYQLAVTFLIM